MKKRINYRRIWVSYHGKIPKDSNNRSFDIHHLDGNSDNNSIDNLIAVSMDEHYYLHRHNGEYGAAAMIARRMKVKPDDLSETVKLQMKELVESGKHNFSVKGYVSVRDKDGNTMRVSKDDPRYLSCELVGVNTGFIVARDSTGNYIRVAKNDSRLLSNELVPTNKDRKQKIVHTNRGHNKNKSWTQQNKESHDKTCKYCDFVGRASHVSRYHNEKCRHKNES
jgi:hypothetical protein